MATEKGRVFIVGVGCTAFTKVCSSLSTQANTISTPDVIAQGSKTDQRRMAHSQCFATILRTRTDGLGSCDKSTPRRRYVLAFLGLFLSPTASAVRHPPAPTHPCNSSGITYDAIEAAFVGYVFGASTCGQAALYQLGLTGIPITNVNNNCATGSTALLHAATLVRSGEARCALALGFERMAPGPLGAGNNNDDRLNPLVPLFAAAARASPGADRGPPNPRVFGAAAAEYFRTYGGGVGHLAKIGVLLFSRRVLVLWLLMDVGWGRVLAAKNHKHALNNPYAQFRAGYSEAEVLASPQITNELTKFMCSPTSVERKKKNFGVVISGSR